MKKKRVIFIMCFLMGVPCFSEANISIIPQPAEIQIKQGIFIINPETRIMVNFQTQQLGRQLKEMLSSTGNNLELIIDGNPSDNQIVLTLEPALNNLPEEGYVLKVTEENIQIQSSSQAGLFYGIQTVRQLLPAEHFQSSPEINTEWKIPCVVIRDYPRFKWRGMHLDVCRHFMPKEFVKKYIDLLAMHKMNTFHWHLTEDQGWRIEIKKYPKLTEVGAWRKETVIGRNSDKYDNTPHGGFYTQNEIREIVEYAKQRYVTIVPEIEMPGHSVAALAAYPELSCTGGPFEVYTRWGVSRDVYCAGKEKTFEFLQDILTEVIDMFPDDYIHIGGDECPKDRWKECQQCQARILNEGLKDEHELQSYFIKRIEKILNAKGKKLIGWDEILEGGLAPSATVMSWRGELGGINAARAGHDVVMAPNSHTYFDYYQADPKKEPLAIGGFLPLEKVYSYNPIPEVLTKEQSAHVLGVQAQIWTEYILTPESVEYMAYPRVCALSEVAWTPLSRKEYKIFYSRLQEHLRRLKFLDVNFRPLDPPK